MVWVACPDATKCIAPVGGPLVARYIRTIRTQRDWLARIAMPLSEISKLRLRQHFSDAGLDRVRIVQADLLPIPDPPFYPVLRWLGLGAPEPCCWRKLDP